MNKFSKSVLVFLVAAATLANAAPVDPEDEVELIRPENTNTRDPETETGISFGSNDGDEGGIPTIIIIRNRGGSSDNSPFGGSGFPFGNGGGYPFRGVFPSFRRRFPFFGGNGGGFDFPVFGQDDGGNDDAEYDFIPEEKFDTANTGHDDDGDDDYIDIFDTPVTNNRPSIRDLLGVIFGQQPAAGDDDETEIVPLPDETEEEDSRPPCGLFCLILNSFGGGFNGGFPTFPPRNDHGGSGSDDDGEFDVHNSTYNEKVLPDGSVVKVNKTVISDTDEDGNQFYFHSTVLHNVGGGSDGEADDAEDEVPVETDVEEEATDDDDDQPEDDLEEVEFSEFTPTIFEEEDNTDDNAEVPVLDDMDETLNEVLDDDVDTRAGGYSRKKRNDPFAQQQIIVHRAPVRGGGNTDPLNDDPESGWVPLHGDTVVNDLITENGRRGGLVRIEPDSEFVRRDPTTGEMVSVDAVRNTRRQGQEETQDPWAQQTIM